VHSTATQINLKEGVKMTIRKNWELLNNKQADTKRIRQYIYLTEDEKYLINTLARRSGASTSNYIGELIRAELKRNPGLKIQFKEGKK